MAFVKKQNPMCQKLFDTTLRLQWLFIFLPQNLENFFEVFLRKNCRCIHLIGIFRSNLNLLTSILRMITEFPFVYKKFFPFGSPPKTSG